MRIELLWFQGCPNHLDAEALLRDVLAEEGIEEPVIRIDVEDEETGKRLCFPGSPTIRIDGRDIEPDWAPCDECTPRCRLYATSDGLRGVPERQWITNAIRRA